MAREHEKLCVASSPELRADFAQLPLACVGLDSVGIAGDLGFVGVAAAEPPSVVLGTRLLSEH
jgi:hypothetical protein